MLRKFFARFKSREEYLIKSAAVTLVLNVLLSLAGLVSKNDVLYGVATIPVLLFLIGLFIASRYFATQGK